MTEQRRSIREAVIFEENANRLLESKCGGPSAPDEARSGLGSQEFTNRSPLISLGVFLSSCLSRHLWSRGLRPVCRVHCGY